MLVHVKVLQRQKGVVRCPFAVQRANRRSTAVKRVSLGLRVLLNRFVLFRDATVKCGVIRTVLAVSARNSTGCPRSFIAALNCGNGWANDL